MALGATCAGQADAQEPPAGLDYQSAVSCAGLDFAALTIVRDEVEAGQLAAQAATFRQWAGILGSPENASDDIAAARTRFLALSSEGEAFERREALKAAATETIEMCKSVHDEWFFSQLIVRRAAITSIE